MKVIHTMLLLLKRHLIIVDNVKIINYLKYITMKNIYIVLFFICSLLLSQNNVLLSIGDEDISVDEFMKTYYKNRLDTDTLSFAASLEEYLDLYVNFKLKVIDAEQAGLDTLPAFLRELEGYRRQLVKPYLTDSEISQQLLEEAYERLKYEVSVSHILIQSEGKDTVEAFRQISKIEARLKNGESFLKLAEEFSDDPSVKENGGNLGYFTALYMVYPFETAAYSNPVGSISKPVKTRFGYHILKVNDKRESRGEIKVAHIMIRVDNKKTEAVNLSKTKIFEIYDSLVSENGLNFAELAKNYSDDKKSGAKGGELDWFGTNKMVKKFEESAFSLDSIGMFSKPFQTDFGWHIVKLLDKKELPSFDQIQPSLKKKIERDSRSQKTRNVVINRLKDEWGFVENEKSKNIFYRIIDEDFFNGGDILNKIKGLGTIMFIFNESKSNTERYVYQKDFAEYLIAYRSRLSNNSDIELIVDQLYKTFKEQKILDIEMNNLEEKHDDFRLLINEYHDGILLFNLSEDKVWNKAIQDTVGLLNFYTKNNTNYMWSDRVSVKIYTAKDEKIKKRVLRYLNRFKDKDKELMVKINKDSSLNLSVEDGVFEKGDNSIVDDQLFSLNLSLLKKGDIIVSSDNNQIIVLVDILPASVKDLEDIKGIVISDYQSVLEKDWLKELRTQYPVNINMDLFNLAKNQNFVSDDSSFGDDVGLFNCEGFMSCFQLAGQIFGYSSDVYFGWNGQIYTTEIKPLDGNN